MRVLVLGGTGMLGHKLAESFPDWFETFVTVRRISSAGDTALSAAAAKVMLGVTTQEFGSVIGAFNACKPDVVVNCIGIVKQDAAAKDPLQCISVNALFPHRLAQLCGAVGARLIHISTDCIFTGEKGRYLESDISDAQDLYGRTKFLGEVNGFGQLTIRTSIIGHERGSARGLVDWFINQQGQTVRGFKNAIFTGFPTISLASIICDIIINRKDIHGIWNIAAKPISKYDLLTLINEVYDLRISVVADSDFHCDRSLDGSRFEKAAKFAPLAWPELVHQMYTDAVKRSEFQPTV